MYMASQRRIFIFISYNNPPNTGSIRFVGMVNELWFKLCHIKLSI